MMKHLYLLIFSFILSCNQIKQDKLNREPSHLITYSEISYNDYLSRIDTIILGDINFDHIVDTAIVYPVKFKNLDDMMMGCLDDYPITKIHFSHDDSWLIKSYTIDILYFSVLDDINEDGTKEIALIPGWYTSCNSSFYVYTNHNGIWQRISGTSVFSCSNSNYKVIKTKKNQFIVPDRTYSEVVEDIIDTIKTVNFPKFAPDVYEIILDTNTSPGLINNIDIELLKPNLRGLITFYSGLYGSGCNFYGEESCELTRALKLGKQGSEKQLNLIKKFFPNDTIADLLILQECYQRPSGASTFSEYNYLYLKDFGNKVIVDYEIIYHNKGTFIEETYRDVYVYKNEIFKAKTSKVLKTRAYTFEDIGED